MSDLQFMRLHFHLETQMSQPARHSSWLTSFLNIPRHTPTSGAIVLH